MYCNIALVYWMYCQYCFQYCQSIAILCHRLRDSGSTVVTMTSKVNGKTEILTPCKSETAEHIETKIGLSD